MTNQTRSITNAVTIESSGVRRAHGWNNTYTRANHSERAASYATNETPTRSLVHARLPCPLPADLSCYGNSSASKRMQHRWLLHWFATLSVCVNHTSVLCIRSSSFAICLYKIAYIDCLSKSGPWHFVMPIDKIVALKFCEFGALGLGPSESISHARKGGI